ncbi:ATP-binding protein [Methanolobus sp.]|uniref:PAS domain-containing sensor histidine kinase n=1 Tax=Methanolobus sp. TaxID=1874737 RepID=UPI0025F3B033|nr:ATP-binding protein [Methanolobus sp.]
MESFSDVAEQLPIGIIVLNADRQIEYCNPAVLEILDYNSKDLLGKNICEAPFFKDLQARANLSCPELFAYGCKAVGFEQTCITGNGKEIPTRWKIIPAETKGKDHSSIICCIDHALRDGQLRPNPEDHDKKYVRILENGNDGIVIIQDFVVKYMNAKLVDILGYDKKEVIGRNFMGFVSAGSKNDAYHMYVEIEGDIGLQQNQELNITSKTGKIIPMKILSSSIEYEGTPADLVILHDISQRKSSEKELQEYSQKLKVFNELIRRKLNLEKSISYVSSVLVAPVDIDIAIEECLGNIGTLCGASRVYLFMIKEEVMDNTHEWRSEGVEPQKENLRDLPVSMFPWWMDKLHKGEIIHVTDVSSMPPEAHSEKEILEMQDISSLIVLPLYVSGKMSGFVGMDNVVNTGSWSEEDINVLGIMSNLVGSAIERRQNEETLSIHSMQLEKAYDELKVLDRMKSEFLANLSHELKTPLHSIYGYSSLLDEEVFGKLNENQRKSVDSIVRNSERLGSLIDSLLYMGNVLAGTAQYTIDTILLENILDRAIETYSDQARQKSVTVSKNVIMLHPFIDGDVNFLIQLMDKLMDNAVKFTLKGGQVNLSAYEEGNDVHIEVQDTGIGIPEENVKDIFTSFYQVDGSSTRKYGGNGLGLYVSKLIVEAHQGRIWLESEKGIGTTVHVLLPKEQVRA